MKCSPRKPKPKSRCKKRKAKNCARPGRITTNPFLNFLREYRRKNCGKTMTAIAIKGAKVWCSMTKQQKCPYIMAAKRAQTKKPKKRRGGCC